MPRTAKTLVFNDPTDNIQITAHRLRSSTDMSLNIETSNNLYVTSDNFVLNASDLSTNVTVRAPNYYINGISLEQYIEDQTSGGGDFVLQNEDASLNNVDISGDLKLTNVNKTFTVAGTSTLQSLNAGTTDISDTLQVDGATTLSSTLNVVGASTLQDLSAGATDISSTLNVTGATTLSSTLQVDGAATFSNSIAVTSDSTFNSNLTVSNELIIGDSSSRGGRIYSGSNNNQLIIDPYAIDSNGGSDASGAVYIYGDLYVNGNTVSVSSTEITLDDKDLHLVPNESDSNLLAGAGILVGANNNAKLTYNGTNNVWQTNIGLDVSGELTTKSLNSSGAISGTTITASTKFIGDISSGGTSTFTNVDINGGAIDGTTIGSTSPTTGAFTSITASSDVTFSQNLDVSGLDVSNNATVGGTLGVTGATTLTGSLSANGGITISGDLVTANSESKLFVSKSTFEIVNDYSTLGTDTSNVSGSWITPSGYSKQINLKSSNSAVKMEFKVNFRASPEADQFISFQVTRGSTPDINVVFQDCSLGSNMGVTITNVYNGTFIDTTPGEIGPTYTLHYKLDCPSSDTIDTEFGILGSANNCNYIYLQELYVP